MERTVLSARTLNRTLLGRQRLLERTIVDPRPNMRSSRKRQHPVHLSRSRRATGDEPERTFHNAYLLRFGPDGRCADFNEFYMEERS